VKTIDTATNTLDSGGVGDETFPSGSAGIALTPDQSQIWVAHSDPNFFVNRIQTDGSDGAQPPLTNLGSGSGPKAIAFTPDGSRAYVASVNGAGVFPIDTATGVASAAIPLPDSARSIAITPDGSRAFVPSAGNNSNVHQIDLATNTVVSPTITFSSGPANLNAVAITPGGGRLYVAGGPLPDPGKVVGLSLASRELTGPPIDVGLTPIAMAIVPDKSPTARLTAPATAIAGVPVSFDAGASSDSDGSVNRYAWNYGDGTAPAGAGPTPKHAFAPGTYTVRVTVSDDDGCSVSALYTGQTAYCSGSAGASASRTLVALGMEVGGVSRNVHKGTAKVTVQVPAAGSLTLSGRGLAPQSATAAGSGKLALAVRAMGPAKHKLKRKGRLTVHPAVAFTPQGGSAQSQTLTVKLKRTRRPG